MQHVGWAKAKLDHAVNSMLASAYQQQSHMRYAAAVVAQERIKNIANYQQNGGGTHPAAAPSNSLVPSQNSNQHDHHWHQQEYRAAAAAQPLTGSALYRRRQFIVQQQQQLTKSTMSSRAAAAAQPLRGSALRRRHFIAQQQQQQLTKTTMSARAAAAAQPLRGSALCMSQFMAQQQQLTKSTMSTSPPSLTPKKKTMSATAKKTAKKQDGNTSCNIKMLQPPRKPLNAYNFFFQDQRANLLGSKIIEEEHDDPRERRKRRHRKSHGKIGFTQLAKHVGESWKTLDAETRKSYDVKFQQDKKRYAAELAEYEEQLSNMIDRAQVKKAVNTLKAQEAELRNMKTEHRIAVEEAKFLELKETLIVSARQP
jgi:hypothetical protein